MQTPLGKAALHLFLHVADESTITVTCFLALVNTLSLEFALSDGMCIRTQFRRCGRGD